MTQCYHRCRMFFMTSMHPSSRLPCLTYSNLMLQLKYSPVFHIPNFLLFRFSVLLKLSLVKSLLIFHPPSAHGSGAQILPGIFHALETSSGFDTQPSKRHSRPARLAPRWRILFTVSALPTSPSLPPDANRACGRKSRTLFVKYAY